MSLFISAAHKSSGKTTISVGLGAALAGAGHSVQTFKKGPDYIDPMWHRTATGRDCINLDFYTQTPAEIRWQYAQASRDAQLTLIEGNKGLYDGLDLDGSNSNAALAELLGTPVVLVLDARGMTRGIAPLILGYQAFDPKIRIVGVILNQVGGRRHEAKLRAVIEHYTEARVLGAVARDPSINIDERHIGLIPSNEASEAGGLVARLARVIGDQVDLRLIAELARSAPIEAAPPPQPAPSPVDAQPLRIGIAMDAAFGFYYPGDLRALEDAGAALVPVNTLVDGRLPELDALFIGGGFPETQMEALEANASLRADIRQAIEDGLPTYAECGGLMYLARGITWGGQRHAMVGVLPGEIRMTERPQGRGYVRLRETVRLPWPASGAPVTELCAHEFHYSAIELDPGAEAVYAYEVRRGAGIDGRHDGFVYKNLVAGYTHQRHTWSNPWATRFVAFARQVKQRKPTGGS